LIWVEKMAAFCHHHSFVMVYDIDHSLTPDSKFW
jgi:hypothetical protein